MASKDISRYQASTKLLILKRSFRRLVREILRGKLGCSDLCMQVSAVETLQEACEALIVTLLARMNLAALHAGRVTVQCMDLRYLQEMGATGNPYDKGKKTKF